MEKITIEITILQPAEKVWEYLNSPLHIVKWNFAAPHWHCPRAENDLKVGGILRTRMEAKDKSYGFDFLGIYDEIIPLQFIRYHLEDGRNVCVELIKLDPDATKVIQTFDPEKENSREMQREGWYSILNNFHKYVENH